jgi:glycerol uptake facilitator protein
MELSTKKIAMLGAEFLGTGLLTLAVISIKTSGVGYSFFVALGAGLAYAVLSFVLGSNSGAHLNPALTIGLWTTRKIKSAKAVLYVVLQLLGGWAAYGVYVYLVKTHLQNTGGAYSTRVMVAEGLGTLVFVFGWAAAAAQKYEGLLWGATVGASLALGILVAAIASNGLINPALAIGTHAWDVFGSSGWGNYVLGPVVGGIVGVNLYNYVFSPMASKMSTKTSTSKKK